MKAGGLERQPKFVELTTRIGQVAGQADQPIDRKHAEPDGFHVEGSNRAAQGVGFIQKLIPGLARGQCLQQRPQRIEFFKGRSGLCHKSSE